MQNDWKCGLITPLYKSIGSKQDFKNYKASSALALLQNYFLCWTQIVKGAILGLLDVRSKLVSLKNQSSINYFLQSINFINDLSYALDLNFKLFADDTTQYETFDLETKTFVTVVQDFYTKNIFLRLIIWGLNLKQTDDRGRVLFTL